MIWTGKGVLSVKGKDIFPGDTIPEGVSSETIKALKAKGDIDGKLTGKQWEELQDRVEENKKKSGGKESVGHAGPKGGENKELKEEKKSLKKELKDLGENDPRAEAIISRLAEIEEALK